MRYTYRVPDVRKAYSQQEDEIAKGVTAAMGDVTAGLKEDLREITVAAGLGGRLAQTWRGQTYPKGRPSIGAAAYAWSAAPKILYAFSQGATIRAGNGKRYLAIPTSDVPKKRQGQHLTPAEVEERFGRPLQFIDPQDKGFFTPSVRRPGIAFLVLKNLVVRKATGRFRNASARELARGIAGQRALSAVVFFILVPQVRISKRLDLDVVARRWTVKVPDLIANRLR